jgi:monofunctional biosynthetic peptidoglycan transglycosylase
VFNPPTTLTMLSRAREDTSSSVMPDYRWVALSEVPAHVASAALSSEDSRFYTHRGFDWGAIEQALSVGGHGGGGSSISQQTAKNVFLWQHRSWFRKGLEIWYTFWMEQLVPKHRILEVYLNVAETGPMTFGIEAGARRWFSCSASELTPFQSAQLISLLPAPRDWTPEDRHVRARAHRITSWASPLPIDWRTQ